MLTGVERALLAVLIIVLMVGMGATLERSQLAATLRRPKGLLIGLASQFGWMPLIAFGLAKGLGLPNELALGLLIVGCTPGGTTSNLFAYLARADVALSISMTVVSTVVAVVAMPLVLILYGPAFTDSSFALPTKDIMTTLVVILLPVAVGMTIRARRPALAKTVERVGSLSGVGVLLLLIGSALVNQSATFAKIPVGGYIAAIGLGLVGTLLGYASAVAVGLSVPERRAVAFETGIQNSPLAIAVILATFPAVMQEQLLWMPLLYALSVLILSSLVAAALRWMPS